MWLRPRDRVVGSEAFVSPMIAVRFALAKAEPFEHSCRSAVVLVSGCDDSGYTDAPNASEKRANCFSRESLVTCCLRQPVANFDCVLSVGYIEPATVADNGAVGLPRDDPCGGRRRFGFVDDAACDVGSIAVRIAGSDIKFADVSADYGAREHGRKGLEYEPRGRYEVLMAVRNRPRSFGTVRHDAIVARCGERRARGTGVVARPSCTLRFGPPAGRVIATCVDSYGSDR